MKVKRPLVISMRMVSLSGFTAEMRLLENHSEDNHVLIGNAPAHGLSVGLTNSRSKERDMTRDEHEALHLLGKALHDAKKMAFRIDHTRPNAEINAEIDAVIEAELLRETKTLANWLCKLYGCNREIEDIPTVIFDIDGTLADITHRVHLAQAKKFNEFFDAMVDDVPNKPIVALLNGILNTGSLDTYLQVIYCTGRPEKYRSVTQSFINDIQGYSRDCPLLMRPNKQRSVPDYEIKQGMLDGILNHVSKENILYAVDDRQQVVDMWRSNGITCLQCAVGNF